MSGAGGIRAALEGKRGSQFWRSLEELAAAPDFLDHLHNEWPRQAGIWDQAVDRRHLLRLMGASLALAGLAGCGRSPEKIVPYVRQPAGATPGEPRHYATALVHDGYARPVIGEAYDGRPTQLAGNPDHPASRGATSVFDQAAILGLYDPDRSQAVRRKGVADTYNSFLAMLIDARARWRTSGGKGFAILTGRITSPTLLAAIATLRKTYPDLRWYGHEPVDGAAAAEGAKLAFGRALDTIYRFEDARVVVSLDGDFLDAASPGQIVYAREFMAGRKAPERRAPTRHYAVESTPGLTGAAAEHVLLVKAGRVEMLARGLAQRLGIDAVGPDEMTARERRWLDAAARDLAAHHGAAPVAVGSTQPPVVHALAHAINDRLGNSGHTVHYVEPVAASPDGDVAALARDLAAGRIETLASFAENPAYSAPADLGLADLIRTRTRLFIHSGLYVDETARIADWHVPARHDLESWGDARAFDGTVTIQQPLIEPLYEGRSAIELIAAFAGRDDAAPRTLVREHWQAVRGEQDFEAFWRGALKAGVVEGTAATPVTPTLRANLGGARDRPTQPDARPGIEVQFRPDPSAWDGRYINNGWLQELARPLTKLVWGNAAMIAPAHAARLGIETGPPRSHRARRARRRGARLGAARPARRDRNPDAGLWPRGGGAGRRRVGLRRLSPAHE